jgi:hypothetical protein
MIRNEPDRLAAAWQQAQELERRTFSNISVTDPVTGVKLLQVVPLAADPGKSQVTVKDQLGHDLLRNDTAAGWGLAAPQASHASYPYWPVISATGSSFIECWSFWGYCYSPAIEYAYIHGTEFSSTTAETQVEYSTTQTGPWTVVTGSTTQSNQDVSDITTVFTVRSGTFTLPLTSAGQLMAIRLTSRVASGPGAKAWCSPVYLNGV